MAASSLQCCCLTNGVRNAMVTSENAADNACLGTNLRVEQSIDPEFYPSPRRCWCHLENRGGAVVYLVWFLFLFLFFVWCLLLSWPALSESFLDIHFTEPVILTFYEILLGSHVTLINKADLCFDSGTLIFHEHPGSPYRWICGPQLAQYWLYPDWLHLHSHQGIPHSS